MNQDSPSANYDNHDGTVPLSSLLNPACMVMDFAATDKDVILQTLSAPLVTEDIITEGQRDLFLEHLRHRESLCSTGIGHGTAIPHPRMPMPGLFPEPLVIYGRAAEPVDFQALDGQPVQHFFLICVSRDDIHLRILNKIAKVMLNCNPEALKQASNRDDILASIQQIEAKLENP